jgi:hypothetical protein
MDAFLMPWAEGEKTVNVVARAPSLENHLITHALALH